MTNFTFQLSSQDSRVFQDLARLVGKDESAYAGDIVRSYVAKQSSDRDVQAGLRAIEKLRGHTEKSAPKHGTAARRKASRSRVAQGRSLANLPDGLEVTFEGKWARINAGQLELDGSRFGSPSPAAVHAAGGGSYNGWVVWKDNKGRTLAEIHQQYAGPR